MSDGTAISWCDATFNPWWGCAKVSPACDNCYAERDARRFSPGRVLWGVNAERREFGDDHWAEPLRWARQPFSECAGCGWRGRTPRGIDRYPVCCARCREPLLKPARRRVFCASMADVFDVAAPPGARARLFRLILDTPELDWLILTKRIGNAHRMMTEAMIHLDRRGKVKWPLSNVWLGATVVNQEEADRDIPKLLATPARVRFLSIEPMLERLELLPSLRSDCWYGSRPGPGGRGGVTCQDCMGTGHQCRRVHWVIAGGESGPRARPAHPDWFRSLRDQCAAAGVPFHFKQWGSWLPCEVDAAADGCTYVNPIDGVGLDKMPEERRYRTSSDEFGEQHAFVGAKLAGRALDGVEHNGFPT